MNDNNPNSQGNIVVVVILGVTLLLSLIFGFWSFTGMQDYKNNAQKKIDAAVEKQIKITSDEKDAEYAEKDKSPVKVFSGSATFGSVSVDHPKTWSVYQDNSSNSPVNVFFGPNFVSSDKSALNALRIQVLESSYSQELDRLEKDVEKGLMTASAFRATKVPDVLGVRLDGEVSKDIKGSIILLPLRDKTIKIWTESEQFLPDFDNFVVPSISFVP